MLHYTTTNMPSQLQAYKHYNTPQRCKTKGTFEIFERKGITLRPEDKEDIFCLIGLSVSHLKCDMVWWEQVVKPRLCVIS